MSTHEEMVAHGRSVEEIARELGAASLAYLSRTACTRRSALARAPLRRLLHGRVPTRDDGEGDGKFALEQVATVAAAPRAG